MVVVDCLLQEQLWVLNACFFSDLFDHFHVNLLGDFNRGLHGFHCHRDATVLASFFELDQSRVPWEESEGFFCRFVGALKISDSFEQNGEVGRGRSMLFVEVKANLEGLSCTPCILLCLKKDSPVEPSHVARWVERDGFVERCQRAFDIVSPTSLFPDREEDFNHLLRVFDVLQFWNHVSRGFRRLLFAGFYGTRRLIFHGIKGIIY